MQPLNLKNIESSYSDNNYGDVLYYLTKSFKPKTIVELGAYQGYSSLHITSALSEQNYNSEFTIIDLFDKYIYEHCNKNKLIKSFKKNNLLNLNNVKLNIIQEDAIKYADNFKDNSIDLLHIDMNNDGDVLEKCFNKYHKKVKLFGFVIIEGGSEERDYIDWMIRRKKMHIRNFIESCFFKVHYDYIILKLFPSLTIAQKIRK